MEGPAPPRETRDAAVRVRLATAAIRLFTRQGYAATSVREIVESAGVTKPALYYHFKSKEGIYLESLREATAEFRSLLEAFAPGDEPAEIQLRRFCAALYDLFLRRIDIARLAHSILYGPPQGAPFFDYHAVHEQMVESIRRLVLLGIERGEFGGAEEDGMTLAVLGAFNVASEADLIRPESGIGREGLDRTLTVVFNGMRAGKRS